MAPQTNKVKIVTSASTPHKNDLLLPAIDDISNFSNLPTSAAIERITSKIKSLPAIRKESKIDIGGKYFDYR